MLNNQISNFIKVVGRPTGMLLYKKFEKICIHLLVRLFLNTFSFSDWDGELVEAKLWKE